MAFPRRQHNLTILADGNVLATGGQSSAAVNSLVDLDHAVFDAELFDTGKETWRTLGAANRVREYHSTAILLPDGRVMTGGGGICGVCQQVGYLEKNVEYFEPPYLFRANGSGEYADRPVIASAPASVGYNTSYSVTSTQAASIAKVGLVKMGAPTHGDDQGQRYVPATFTRSGTTTLTVQSPANVNQAPPGYYMLFIVDSAGVPSVAKFVRLTAIAPAAPAPVRVTIGRPGGRCVDVDHAVFLPGTRIQMWDCNATKAQRWARPADATFRVSTTMCMGHAPGTAAPDMYLRLVTCTGAERWTVRSDGTIRPVSNANVCLTATGNLAEQVKLATCTLAASQMFRYS